MKFRINDIEFETPILISGNCAELRWLADAINKRATPDMLSVSGEIATDDEFTARLKKWKEESDNAILLRADEIRASRAAMGR